MLQDTPTPENASHVIMPNNNPLTALVAQPDGAVLAILTDTIGPSYRNTGTMMVFWPNGKSLGHLSSGCIENDLAQHAQSARETGAPTSVRYGQGSPFFDLQLPCGGGFDILLIPTPDIDQISIALIRVKKRKACTVVFNRNDGSITLDEPDTTGWIDHGFAVKLQPKLAFCVCGHGAEATAFATLALSLDFDVRLFTPEPERLQRLHPMIKVSPLVQSQAPNFNDIDPWSAIVLFFHDHDWEPPILYHALKTAAFYVGAQGSKRTNETRLQALAELGSSAHDCTRLRSPIGLINSVRDEKTLAVSVLADIMAEAKTKRIA